MNDLSTESSTAQPAELPTELHLSVKNPMTAIDCLKQGSDFSVQQLKQAMQKGAVWVSRSHKTNSPIGSGHTQRIRRAKKTLNTGDEVHLYFNPTVLKTTPIACTLIADHGGYSVWFKPNGVYSQGSKWGDHCTITRWAEQQLTPERPAFLVHRLDRATCGLMLIAHSKKAAQAFSALFETRQIEKCYLAMVHGTFPSNPITVGQAIDERKALSHFQLLEQDGNSNTSIVDVKIETGRKHQIRRHLAGLGHPIVGDRLHGIENTQQTGRDLQLCAYRLVFTCPFENTAREFVLPTNFYPWHLSLSTYPLSLSTQKHTAAEQ